MFRYLSDYEVWLHSNAELWQKRCSGWQFIASGEQLHMAWINCTESGKIRKNLVLGNEQFRNKALMLKQHTHTNKSLSPVFHISGKASFTTSPQSDSSVPVQRFLCSHSKSTRDGRRALGGHLVLELQSLPWAGQMQLHSYRPVYTD